MLSIADFHLTVDIRPVVDPRSTVDIASTQDTSDSTIQKDEKSVQGKEMTSSPTSFGFEGSDDKKKEGSDYLSIPLDDGNSRNSLPVSQPRCIHLLI